MKDDDFKKLTPDEIQSLIDGKSKFSMDDIYLNREEVEKFLRQKDNFNRKKFESERI